MVDSGKKDAVMEEADERNTVTEAGDEAEQVYRLQIDTIIHMIAAMKVSLQSMTVEVEQVDKLRIEPFFHMYAAMKESLQSMIDKCIKETDNAHKSAALCMDEREEILAKMAMMQETLQSHNEALSTAKESCKHEAVESEKFNKWIQDMMASMPASIAKAKAQDYQKVHDNAAKAQALSRQEADRARDKATKTRDHTQDLLTEARRRLSEAYGNIRTIQKQWDHWERRENLVKEFGKLPFKEFLKMDAEALHQILGA